MSNFYLLQLLRKKHALLLRSVYYELKSLYAGSVLGLFWVLIGPIILMAAYSLVYLYVFKVKPDDMSSHQYVMYIISGLIPYLGLVQSIQKSASSIVQNKSILFNTLYPVEFIPIRNVLATNISTLFGISALLIYKVLSLSFQLSFLCVFFYFINMTFFLFGISLIISLLTIALRDIENALQYVFMLLLFITPIGFFPEAIPHSFKIVVYLNPVYYFIRPFQEILAYNQLPSLSVTACSIGLSTFMFFLGSKFFKAFKISVYELI